ncbi:mitochondrial ribosomal protein subunit L20-domain-containing protein [Halenospora varia]|nr:mitochondrial ribosomal protein subunit L20-domain-containing protein [Halenospora varia]
MDARLIRRPLLDLASGRSQCLLSLNASTRRHQSSYRRAKQRLNVKPDSSFLQSNNSPQQDHIIFNPPSAAPSVFHTPLKFLPKEDKRRQFLEATQSKLKPNSTRLPPLLQPKKGVPHHHLSDADIAEIQRLKREEPDQWNNNKLARKFNCSGMFISICLSQAGSKDVDQLAQHNARLEAIKERWGPRRRMAHEDKQRRMQMALRDE